MTRTFTPRKTVDWEAYVAYETKRALIASDDGYGPELKLPFEGPVSCLLEFRMLKPKSYPKTLQYHTKRPDLDNLEKSVIDGVQMASFFKDDSQIFQKSSEKRYVSDQAQEGVQMVWKLWM